MPLSNGEELTPDEAIAKGCCPECGIDLKTVSPHGELNRHWETQPRDNRAGAEGLRRMNLLKEYIANLPKH
jgi:hypothetical protein